MPQAICFPLSRQQSKNPYPTMNSQHSTVNILLLVYLGVVQWPFSIFPRPAQVLAATNTCQLPNQPSISSNPVPPAANGTANGGNIPSSIPSSIPSPIPNLNSPGSNPQISPLPVPDPLSNSLRDAPVSSVRDRGNRLGRYRLGPGDQIYIEVQPFNELSLQTAISPEGSIVLPLIGAISVEKLTPAQAQQKIQAELNQYLVNPIVRLQLLVPRPINVTITGEVARPGFYPVPPTGVTLATLLATAGGTTANADLRQVRLRWTEDDGILREQKVNLLTPLTQGQPIPDIPLEDGDAIVVPKRESLEDRQYNRSLIDRSNLVAPPSAVEITVLGEVAQPGFYILPPSIRPLADALLIAGGATPAADLRCVIVRRLQDNGTLAEPIFLDIYNALQTNGQTLPDFPLSNGDVVIIPKLPLADPDYDNNLASRTNISAQQPVQITIVGEVTQPGYHILPPSLRPLPDALLIAGGASPTADLKNIQVRRLLADGTISEEKIDLFTPLMNGEELPSIRLSNGDVVLVPKRPLGDDRDYDNNIVGQSNLAATQPVQITVLGEVAQPGFHILNPAPRPLPNALLIAGGTTSEADLRAVRVRRLIGNGTISEEVVDLFTPLQTGAELPSLRLGNGDVVYVPKIEPGTDQDYDRLLIARSTLANPQMTVRILSYPGQGASLITLRNGSTFSDILNTIPLSQADLRDIAVIRFDPEQGRAVTRKVDVKKLLEGDNSQNIPLQDNDVVVIGRNLLAKLTYSLNTFTQPFRDILGFLLFFDQLRDSADALFGPGSN